MRDAILIGLVLACVILYLFLHDWRSSLIAGLVIPVTIAITVLALWLLGQSFNLMTLGGLAAAIGLVIDDAIVVVENIVLHRDAGESRVEAVRKALHEISRPLIGSTITPVVVFLPLVAVTGVTGSFFRALAITMAVVAADFACAGRDVDAGARDPDPQTARADRRRFRSGRGEQSTRHGPIHAAVDRLASCHARVVAAQSALARRGVRALAVVDRTSPIKGWAPTCCRRWMKADSSWIT